ncbi:hypothetical protein ACTXT7_014229 [Hymenolepis weldensis]
MSITANNINLCLKKHKFSNSGESEQNVEVSSCQLCACNCILTVDIEFDVNLRKVSIEKQHHILEVKDYGTKAP